MHGETLKKRSVNLSINYLFFFFFFAAITLPHTYTVRAKCRILWYI